MQIRKYFVSYQFARVNHNDSYGFGCTEVVLTEKVKGYPEVQEMINYVKQMIKTDLGDDVNVVILYWRPFED